MRRTQILPLITLHAFQDGMPLGSRTWASHRKAITGLREALLLSLVTGQGC